MKYRYSRFTGEDLDGLDLEELLSRLSDLLLGSGFDNPHGMPYEDDEGGHSIQTLHDAILEALLNGGLLSDEMLEKLLGKDWRDADDAEERLDALIARILEELHKEANRRGWNPLAGKVARAGIGRQGTGRTSSPAKAS